MMEEDFMEKVWLITGSSRGLGRALAEAVLAAGDKLVATARTPAQLADLVDRYGDQVRTVALDVTDEREAVNAVQVAINAFGRLSTCSSTALATQTSIRLRIWQQKTFANRSRRTSSGW
jgi:NAD(P)-dependent dehydrogenase (short-subunit alcohol dehydrogenase family)